MPYDPVTVYVDAVQLRRQAEAWAKRIRTETGLPLAQPVSAYVRWLIDRDSKRKGGRKQ